MIRLFGVRVHNLKGIDVEIPRGRLTWLTGVSGSGKSSLAFETLYAEAQHRFVAGFSPHARQFLERLDRPDAERIDNLPPAIALRQFAAGKRTGATVAIATELNHYLRLLFATSGIYHDRETGRPLRRDSTETVAALIDRLPEGRRYLIAFPWPESAASVSGGTPSQQTRHRSIADRDRLLDELLENGFTRGIVRNEIVRFDRDRKLLDEDWPSHILVDRLKTGHGASSRVTESLETAFREGQGTSSVWVEATLDDEGDDWREGTLSGDAWSLRDFHERVIDPKTGETLPNPAPALFSVFSPLGACPACGGRGVVAADDTSRAPRRCSDCDGKRLNPTALSVRVDGRDIADWQRMSVVEAIDGLRAFDGECDSSDTPGRTLIPEIETRLSTMRELGLGYLTLDRPLETLSAGESRRVALTTAIGANLVNMLYVLDEPSAGLHPSDRHRVAGILQSLRDAPNTLVVIEHDPLFRDVADWVIALGPGAGREGGEVVYAGPPEKWNGRFASEQADAASDTPSTGGAKPTSADPAIVLAGCRRHNLRDVTLAFPLNRLIAVTGVSGSGKSSLVIETLYPAIQHELGISNGETEASVSGADAIENVVLVDQSAVGRSIRSNAATYLNAFDAIREAFAATHEAKLRNLKPGAFSFNSARGGRCPHCRGAGIVTVDMQFLPDIEVACPECRGARFRPDILEVKLRGRSIAEVLDMTAAEAFAFFRGHNKVLRRIAPLKEVGLGYLPLGQATSTLSGGEVQRLKLASFLSERSAKRTLFLFDEPTIGLHAADVDVLIACLRRLVAVGHSVVAIEHRVPFVRAADWIIDLGPGAGPDGGRVVAEGTPEMIAGAAESMTGEHLK